MIGFWAKNGEPVEALANQLRPTKEPVDRFPLPSRGPVEECKKHYLSSNSLSFPIEVRKQRLCLVKKNTHKGRRDVNWVF